MNNLLSSEAFLDSLFSYIHGKGGEAGYDDQRPVMMARVLTLLPIEALLLEANDFAAIFSAHLYGNVGSSVIDDLESESEIEEEEVLHSCLLDLFLSGRVSLAVDTKRSDIIAFIESIKSSFSGQAYLASVAIHLAHGRRSKRAAVHLFTATTQES